MGGFFLYPARFKDAGGLGQWFPIEYLGKISRATPPEADSKLPRLGQVHQGLRLLVRYRIVLRNRIVSNARSRRVLKTVVFSFVGQMAMCTYLIFHKNQVFNSLNDIDRKQNSRT